MGHRISKPQLEVLNARNKNDLLVPVNESELRRALLLAGDSLPAAPPGPIKALSYDGASSYLRLSGMGASMAGKEGFTWFSSVKVSSALSSQVLHAINTSAGGNVVLILFPLAVRVIDMWTGHGTASMTIPGQYALNDGSWHDVVLVCDTTSATYHVYVDGALFTQGSTVPIVLNEGDTWQLGMEYDGVTPSDWWAGSIRHAAVWDYADHEIPAAMFNGDVLKDAALLGAKHAWKFDSTEELLDYAGGEAAGYPESFSAGSLVAGE